MAAPSIAVQLVADRLSVATGMDTRSLDASRLAWIVEARRVKLGLDDELAYTARLQADDAELDALIDEVVVQETRFFRDPAVFEHLRATVMKLATDFPGPLRFLSAPCGTGQEAYSLAAIVRDLGFSQERCTIDAFDISVGALDAAQKGLYAEQAFRHLTPELARSLATHHGDQWRIHDEIRQRVRFERKNLAELNALGSGTYHLILCRNLFIYLHAEARTALAKSLATALVPGGRLVLGSADRVEEISALFNPLRPAASFAFALRDDSAKESPKNAAKPPVKNARKVARAPKIVRVASTAAIASALTTVDELYQRALQHQQTGNLRSAERRCRQVLYLEPAHLPALELLQSLWHHNPNQRLRHALTARILRTRATLEASAETNA